MKVEMKDSGIPWIGEIPKDWEIRKVKLLYRVFNGSTPKSDNTDFWDGEIKWITPVDMYNNQEIYASIKTITELGYKSCGTTIIPENSIILSTRAPIGQVSMNKVALCTNQGCKSLVLKNESYTKYHFYYFQVQTAVFNMLGRGTTFLELSTTDLNNYLLPVPPFQIQQQIANFLDDKCADIDQLITLQQQMIDELKAYKQSVITEAVCKGLDKSVPMKDSGIEWIGEVPEGWEIIRLRFLCKIITGGQDTVNKVDDGLYPFYVRSPKIERINSYSFDGEAVLMSGDGAGAGRIFHYVNEKFDYHQRVYNIHNITRIKPQLLYYYLTYNFYKKIEEGNAKSTVDSVRLPMLQNFHIVFGSISEQREILDFINKKSSQIDTLISIKQQKIDELKEYKKSMIYEYITGKKQVPNE